MNFNQNMLIGAAVLFAAYKFGPSAVKGAVLAIAANAVAARLPYVQDVYSA